MCHLIFTTTLRQGGDTLILCRFVIYKETEAKRGYIKIITAHTHNFVTSGMLTCIIVFI